MPDFKVVRIQRYKNGCPQNVFGMSWRNDEGACILLNLRKKKKKSRNFIDAYVATSWSNKSVNKQNSYFVLYDLGRNEPCWHHMCPHLQCSRKLDRNFSFTLHTSLLMLNTIKIYKNNSRHVKIKTVTVLSLFYVSDLS